MENHLNAAEEAFDVFPYQTCSLCRIAEQTTESQWQMTGAMAVESAHDPRHVVAVQLRDLCHLMGQAVLRQTQKPLPLAHTVVVLAPMSFRCLAEVLQAVHL